MSDLVKRLRGGVEWEDGDYSIWSTNGVMHIAANRIEQLERVLLQAREAMHSCIPADYSTGHVIHASFDSDAVDAAIAAIDEALKG